MEGNHYCDFGECVELSAEGKEWPAHFQQLQGGRPWNPSVLKKWCAQGCLANGWMRILVTLPLGLLSEEQIAEAH